MKKIFLLFFLLVLLMIPVSSYSQTVRLFAGRYTETGGKGLFVFDLNKEAGTFKLLSEADAGPSPSYFCISKKRDLIYAAGEVMTFKGSKGGAVTSMKYNSEKGSLEKVNEMLVPAGGPCFISLSPMEDFLLLANYSSSSIAVVKLDANGIPKQVTDSVLFDVIDGKVSHPHMIAFDPLGKKVYLTDLGLDRIVIYDFDAKAGTLKQIDKGIVNLQKGSGPRHFVFNSTGTKMYVICELNSTIAVYDVDAKGGLKIVQNLTTLAPDYIDQNACADIHMGKGEHFLYGSNRGENTIVTYRIEADGKLVPAGRTKCGGNWPRNFVIDPTGKFMLVANQKSGNIMLFKIDQKTGLPVETSREYKLDDAVCLKF
jgi:6-phosphogluconolactonase